MTLAARFKHSLIAMIIISLLSELALSVAGLWLLFYHYFKPIRVSESSVCISVRLNRTYTLYVLIVKKTHAMSMKKKHNNKISHTLTYTPVAAAVRIKIQSVLYGDSNSFIYLFFLSWMNRIVFFISFQLNHSSKVNFIRLFSFVYLLDHLGVCIGSCMSFDLFETTNTK